MMAYFAHINEQQIVDQVISIANEMLGEPEAVFPQTCENGQRYISDVLGLEGTWKQTSFNTICGVHEFGGNPIRKNYAGIGYTYDEIRDAFIPPQTFPSWVLDEESCQWVAPKPMPTNGLWWWDEEQQNWVSGE